jgi:hypothetical protein
MRVSMDHTVLLKEEFMKEMELLKDFMILILFQCFIEKFWFFFKLAFLDSIGNRYNPVAASVFFRYAIRTT